MITVKRSQSRAATTMGMPMVVASFNGKKGVAVSYSKDIETLAVHNLLEKLGMPKDTKLIRNTTKRGKTINYTFSEETKMTTVSLPFSGFYNGFFDWHLERYAEAMQISYDEIDSERLKEYYCETYVSEVSRKLGIELKFEHSESPKYYNYFSDHMYVEVPNHIIDKALKTPSLSEFAKSWFTSRPGFISFYEPNIDTWDFDNLDDPQIDCAFAAYLHDCGVNLTDIEAYLDLDFNI